ncbi:MAG TPA: 1-acyl-sn-glycerol-3-phosphate acyltransferase [Frankiaceae bacterium]|nr:1-acyl-sn-glycerol-3-phosphate acyltransferase [Frankiaceae bacterium]
MNVLRFLRHVGIELVRRYHRLEVQVDEPLPDRPCLVVANHGFGGIFDLNVFVVLGVLDQLASDRPLTALTHQLAWTLRVGPLLESVGSRPASRESALDAFAAGHHVVVFPGGDVEASKSFRQRNDVTFAGRSGFAQLAMEVDVPIVPIVTAGAGSTLFVLTDGQALARRLGLDKLLRYKVLPVSISIPWGLNVGLVGLLPYLPLPAKLRSRVLPSMWPDPGESAVLFANRVEATMQSAMDGLVT